MQFIIAEKLIHIITFLNQRNGKQPIIRHILSPVKKYIVIESIRTEYRDALQLRFIAVAIAIDCSNKIFQSHFSNIDSGNFKIKILSIGRIHGLIGKIMLITCSDKYRHSVETRRICRMYLYPLGNIFFPNQIMIGYSHFRQKGILDRKGGITYISIKIPWICIRLVINRNLNDTIITEKIWNFPTMVFTTNFSCNIYPVLPAIHRQIKANLVNIIRPPLDINFIPYLQLLTPIWIGHVYSLLNIKNLFRCK